MPLPIRGLSGTDRAEVIEVAALPVAAVASTGALGVGHAAAGLLTAAYGIGGLAASTAIMIRPLSGDADRAISILAGAVAAALALVVLIAVFWAALIAYARRGHPELLLLRRDPGRP